MAGRDSNWVRQAARAAGIVTYSVDFRSRQVFRSANCVELLGLPEQDEIHNWNGMISPQDRAYVQNALQSLTPGSALYELEYRVEHNVTRRPIILLDRGEAEFDGADRPIAFRGALIDVSSRIGTAALRKSERLRSLIFETGRLAAWHLDSRTQKFSGTDELLGLLETDRAHFGNTASAVEAAIHPEDVASWRTALASALTPGGRMEVEFRIVLRNGGLRWLLSRGEAIRRQDGNVLESYGVMIDITARKQTEEAAARLAAIVEWSEDAIISKSLQGVVTSWNSGAERLFGYTAAEMMGRTISRILPAEYEADEARILNTVRTGEIIKAFEAQRLHKSGRRIHVSVAVSPIRNAQGQVIGASSIARDVTERRNTIERLRQNESRLRLALYGARAGAWDLDVKSRTLHWSPEMFALYGRNEAHGLPERDALLAQIPPAHRKRVQLEFARALLAGGSFTLEFPILRPDGSEIWTSLAGDVIRDATGLPASVRGIDQDITERKNWEKRRAALLRELSHRVKNTLAVIQSIARQTLRSSSRPENFVEAFEGRIGSLAASHSLLTEADWSGARFEDVVRSQLEPFVFDFGKQILFSGPCVVLSSELSTQLGLVIHELAANAAKYGSLSVPRGTVRVLWQARNNSLKLVWRERGGPEIKDLPARAGFGTALLHSSVRTMKRALNRKGMTYLLEFAL